MENTLSADANPFCNSLKTFPKLFIGPNTLNNNKINLIKSSELIDFVTKTSCAPIKRSNAASDAPTVSVIGEDNKRKRSFFSINS